jgi:hypothetical protein
MQTKQVNQQEFATHWWQMSFVNCVWNY